MGGDRGRSRWETEISHLHQTPISNQHIDFAVPRAKSELEILLEGEPANGVKATRKSGRENGAFQGN